MGKADRSPRPLVLTGEEIQRLQGAAHGMLEPGPWTHEKTRLAVMTADLLRRWLADLPVFRSVPVEIHSPVEPPSAAE